MPDVKCWMEGQKEILAIAKEIQSLKPLKLGLKHGAAFLKGRIAKYPPVSRRTKNFVSDRQRRHFFYLMRTKKIEVPYRRGISPGSERHGQSWTIKESRGGLRQTIGSDTSYGPLLQDADEQSQFHRSGGWKTIQTVAEKSADDVNKRIKATHDRALAGGKV